MGNVSFPRLFLLCLVVVVGDSVGPTYPQPANSGLRTNRQLAEELLNNAVQRFDQDRNGSERIFLQALELLEREGGPPPVRDTLRATLNYNLGAIHAETQNWKEVLKYARASLRFNPTFADAYHGLGVALDKSGDPQRALAAYEANMILDGGPISWFNVAKIHSALGDILNAMKHYKFLCDEWPEFARSDGAYHNYGMILNGQGLWEEGNWYMTEYLKIAENFHTEVSVYLGKLEMVDWSTLENDNERIRYISNAKSDSPIPPIGGFSALFMFMFSSEEVLKAYKAEAMQFYHDRQPLPRPLLPYASLARGQRVRVGYLSQKFQKHPMAMTVQSMLVFHDRSLTEVYVYAFSFDDGSPVRTRIKTGVEHYADLTGYRVDDVALRVNRDGINVLVSFDGHMASGPMCVQTYTPAPIQIQMQGDPNSSGGEGYIHYFTADPIAMPPEYHHLFVEKLIMMPSDLGVTYHLTEPSLQDERYAPINLSHAESQAISTEYDLPLNQFMFCSFNRLAKMYPEIFQMWCEILKRVPNSLFWFTHMDIPEVTRKNVYKEAAKYGISPDRFKWTNYMAHDQHLRVKSLCSLYLDIPFHGSHGTGVDLLWAGIPMIAIAGREALASRVAPSLVNAVGSSEMIVRSNREYIEQAVDWATNPQKLATIRSKLGRNRSLKPLYNTKLWLYYFQRKLNNLWTVYENTASHYHISSA